MHANWPLLTQPPKLVRKLTLQDSILLLAGGIIGSGIFLTAQDVALNTRTPLLFLAVWALGLLITIPACFAFAEMGAMFPDSGGQYVYLREAYGDFVAFLYGWMIFTVSNGGTIAALAVGFSLYLGSVFPALETSHPVATLGPVVLHGHTFMISGRTLLAFGDHAFSFTLTRGHLVALSAIAVQTVINVFGVRRGAALQNIATWAKFAAIAAFVLLGLVLGKGSWAHYSTSIPAVAGSPGMLAGIGVALIAVFWAYDGWVYITWVAGEVIDPKRNLPRSLILGLLLVGAIYLSINAVYLYALPITGIARETEVAQAAAVTMFSSSAATWLALMIAVSCFGAMASCILSGARVYYAMAEDGVFFRALARVHPRWHTPVMSLVLQSSWAGALALSGQYDQLFTYVMFMMVLSYVMTTAGLYILRRKMPNAERPYRCTGYPWLPAIYVLLGGLWFINALFQRPREAGWGIFIVSLGVPFYLYWRSQKRSATVTEAPTASR